MAIIKDGNGGTQQLTVDPISTAARVTLYNSSGVEQSAGDVSIPIALNALNASTTVLMDGHNSCGFIITNIGNAANVITAEVSIDDTNYVPSIAINALTGNSTTTVTQAGTYSVSLIGGVSSVRLIVSSYTSGTITGALNAVTTNPDNVSIRTYTNVLSVLNSTTTQLGAGATFTGAWEAGSLWQGIICNAFADQPLTITFQQSTDGTTVTKTDTWTYNANSTGYDATKAINLISKYHRVVITNNGASPTTTLTFQCYELPNFSAMPVSQNQDGSMPTGVRELATYMAAASGITPVATLTFSIKGSATRVIKVTRIGFSMTNTTSQQSDVSIVKYSAVSGGTPSAVTAVPLDSNSGAATAVVQNWTATPATQTAVGTINAIRYSANKVADNVDPLMYVVEFGNSQRGTSALYLRGVSQWLGISISAVANTPVADCWVEWEEV